MNDKAPDGRKILIWHGRDPIADKKRLADTIAEAAVAELFNLDGELVTIDAGQLVPVTKDILREIIARHVASVRLVSRGTFGWDVEFYAFEFPLVADTGKEPDQRILIELTELLLDRVAKAPAAPVTLTPQQQREVRARFKEGEPVGNIAREYKVDIATVRELGR
jgi:hypothetical protein